MFQLLASLQALYTTPVRDERGATAVEYGLMVALIAVVIIGAVTTLGGNLKDLFTSIAGNIHG